MTTQRQSGFLDERVYVPISIRPCVPEIAISQRGTMGCEVMSMSPEPRHSVRPWSARRLGRVRRQFLGFSLRHPASCSVRA